MNPTYKNLIDEFLTKNEIKKLFEAKTREYKKPFIENLKDKDFVKYNKLCRGFDSRLGNLLERIAQNIVAKQYEVLSKKDLDKINRTRKKKVKFDLCYKKDKEWIVMEIKAGGNLDVKKAKSEKEALYERKQIIQNIKKTSVRCFFATAYDTFEKGAEGYKHLGFPEKELLIGERFWEFILSSPKSYEYLLDRYTNLCNNYLEKQHEKSS